MVHYATSTTLLRTPMQRAASKGLRALLAIAQVVSALGTTLVGLTQPTLPDAIAAQVGNAADKVYYYWLQEVETDGDTTDYGPAATDGKPVVKPTTFVMFLPLVSKSK